MKNKPLPIQEFTRVCLADEIAKVRESNILAHLGPDRGSSAIANPVRICKPLARRSPFRTVPFLPTDTGQWYGPSDQKLHSLGYAMLPILRKLADAWRSAYAQGLRWWDRLKKKRKNQLTALIEEEKRRLQGYGLGRRIMATVVDAYFPSARSVAAVAVVLCVVVAVIVYSDRRTAQTETPVLTRLTNIETAIALIFIPITIFVVGLSSRRSSSGITVAEILLRSVYLFPLTVLIIGIVASFALITNARLALVFIGSRFFCPAIVFFKSSGCCLTNSCCIRRE